MEEQVMPVEETTVEEVASATEEVTTVSDEVQPEVVAEEIAE